MELRKAFGWAEEWPPPGCTVAKLRLFRVGRCGLGIHLAVQDEAVFFLLLDLIDEGNVFGGSVSLRMTSFLHAFIVCGCWLSPEARMGWVHQGSSSAHSPSWLQAMAHPAQTG